MPAPLPPTTKPPATVNGSELPPRLLAKLKVEIEGYELIERLGEGGQATVYRAIQKQDGQMVAIKVLHAGPHATEEARARLKREINALRAINHPNIVHAIAAGRTRSGLDCLVMNFIDGKPLDAVWSDPAFAAKVAPQPADLLRFFKSICETVQAAHRKGITHRDLSPSNILIDATGQPHILDFGMASTAFDGIVNGGRDVTVTGQFIGKLKYASPEQARGARTPGTAGGEGGVDIRSDVYALGVMLYQLLTGGAFPYEVVGNVIDVLHNIIHSKPRPPSETVAELDTPTVAMVARAGGTGVLPVAFGGAGVPPAKRDSSPIRRNPPLVNESIEAIVLKALEKDPDRRYQSAGELAADIDRYLAGQPTTAAVWSKHPESTTKYRTFRRAAVAVAAVVLVATLVGVSMNAKTLAVWLGISTAVAPLHVATPAEASLTAAANAGSAVATTIVAAQPEGSQGQLSKLAIELARIQAKQEALNKHLDTLKSRKPPELEAGGRGARGKDSAGPWPSEDFLAALEASAKAMGRTLTLDRLAQDDFNKQREDEADAVKDELGADAILARRAALDAEQSELWARLSWGAFAGDADKADKLFRYPLKADPKADAPALARAKVLSTGVQVRRVGAKAMDHAAKTLATANQGDAPEGESAEPATPGTASATLAKHLEKDLISFHKAAQEAIDREALMNPEDVQAVTELRAHADDLRDAVNGVATSYEKTTSVQASELDRFNARGQLQREFRKAADAACQFDAGLVKLAASWGIAADASAQQLREVTLPGAGGAGAKPGPVQPAERPATNKRPSTPTERKALEEIFPVGSTFTGKWMNGLDEKIAGKENWEDFKSATVVTNNGRVARLEWTNEWAKWILDIELVGEEIRMTSCRQQGNDFHGIGSVEIRNINVTGHADRAAREGNVRLQGTYDWTQVRLKNSRNNWPAKYELQRTEAPAPKEPAAKLEVGTSWRGTRTWKGKSFDQTFEITANPGGQVTIASPAVTGQATIYWTVRFDGRTAKLVSTSSNKDREQKSISGFGGSLTETRLTFDYPEGTITLDLR